MSKSAWSYFDPLSMVVIVLTLLLFVVALFVKGFTHDLLQECGVFLVSVKLIVMSHKNGVSARLAEERLEKIQNLLETAGPQSA
jgi:Na+-translocating ferredoxin:NAD+ oxidoreductase RnfE subunit